YIERLRDETKIPIVYVSHAVSEVARLATDIVAPAGGKVAAHGPAREVMARADLPGIDHDGATALIELEMAVPDEGYSLSLLRSAGGEWRLPKVEVPAGTRLRVRVRARDVMVATARPQEVSALNVVPARIIAIEEAGDGPEALLRLDHAGQ